MSGSGQEALTDVLNWLVAPFRCSGVVRRPSRMCDSGREALTDVKEWSGDPHESSGHLFQMSGSGRETLPNV